MYHATDMIYSIIAFTISSIPILRNVSEAESRTRASPYYGKSPVPKPKMRVGAEVGHVRVVATNHAFTGLIVIRLRSVRRPLRS
jgi:hypothetical protein